MESAQSKVTDRLTSRPPQPSTASSTSAESSGSSTSSVVSPTRTTTEATKSPARLSIPKPSPRATVKPAAKSPRLSKNFKKPPPPPPPSTTKPSPKPVSPKDPTPPPPVPTPAPKPVVEPTEASIEPAKTPSEPEPATPPSESATPTTAETEPVPAPSDASGEPAATETESVSAPPAPAPAPAPAPEPTTETAKPPTPPSTAKSPPATTVPPPESEPTPVPSPAPAPTSAPTAVAVDTSQQQQQQQPTVDTPEPVSDPATPAEDTDAKPSETPTHVPTPPSSPAPTAVAAPTPTPSSTTKDSPSRPPRPALEPLNLSSLSPAAPPPPPATTDTTTATTSASPGVEESKADPSPVAAFRLPWLVNDHLAAASPINLRIGPSPSDPLPAPVIPPSLVLPPKWERKAALEAGKMMGFRFSGSWGSSLSPTPRVKPPGSRTTLPAFTINSLTNAVPPRGRLEGFLMHREMVRFKWEWRRRWVVLSGSVLAVFETDAQKPDQVVWATDLGGQGPREVLACEGLDTELGHRFCFALACVPRLAEPAPGSGSGSAGGAGGDGGSPGAKRMARRGTGGGSSRRVLRGGGGRKGSASASPSSRSKSNSAPQTSVATMAADVARRMAAEAATRSDGLVGADGISCTRPLCHYFQACDGVDLAEWTQCLRVQVFLSRNAPCSTMSNTCPDLCTALKTHGAIQWESSGQVTVEGPSLFPLKNYKLGRLLGKGNFGSVQEANDKRNGETVAIKVVEKPIATDTRRWKVLRAEIACLERLGMYGDSPHVVHLVEVVESLDKVYMVLEYAPGTDLFDYILSNAKTLQAQYTKPAAGGGGASATTTTTTTTAPARVLPTLSPPKSMKRVPVGISEPVARPIIRDITSALVYLHKCGVVHRDMKPENIQIDKRRRAKLLDFGFGMCLPCQVRLQVDLPSTNSPVPGRRQRRRSSWSGQNKLDFAARRFPSHDSDSSLSSQGHTLPAVVVDHLFPPTDMDFHFSGEPLMKTLFGTRYAAAPEIWKKQPYTRAVDSWGLGVVLYMLLMGQPPFPMDGPLAAQAKRITCGDFDRSEPAWSSLSFQARSLITDLLHPDPVQRLRCEAVLVHDWLSGEVAPPPEDPEEKARKEELARRATAETKPGTPQGLVF